MGSTLRLRVVDQKGEPIRGANVWLNTFDRRMNQGNPSAKPPVQASFNPKTDAEGRVVWSNAPAGKFKFDVEASRYMRVNEFEAEADSKEHVVTLSPALVVHGTVRDAFSGASFRAFGLLEAGRHRRSQPELQASSPQTFNGAPWNGIG